MRYFCFNRDSEIHHSSCGIGHVKDHVHIRRTMKVYELFFVVDGELYIEQDGVKYTLKEGEMFIADKEVSYGGWKKSSSIFYWLHLDCEDNVGFDKDGSYEYRIPQYCSIPGRDSMMIIFTVLTQYSMMRNKNDVSDTLSKALLQDIGSLTAAEEKQGVSEYKNQRFQKMIEYFHNSPFLNEVRTLDDMAEYFGYNKNYLTRLFKENIGMTPLQYFHMKKIDRAQELLLLKDMSVANVADVLQFDYYYFNKLFKRLTGMTPKEFKKSSTPSPREYLAYDPLADSKNEE